MLENIYWFNENQAGQAKQALLGNFFRDINFIGMLHVELAAIVNTDDEVIFRVVRQAYEEYRGVAL
jgi:hypothetical protein